MTWSDGSLGCPEPDGIYTQALVPGFRVVFEWIDPDTDLVTLVDVTPVNRTRNFHNFSLETPEFFDDLFLRLVNRETPRSRLRYEVRTADGRRYLDPDVGAVGG